MRLNLPLIFSILALATGCTNKPVDLDFELDRGEDIEVTILDPQKKQPIRSYVLTKGDNEHMRLMSWVGANQSSWFSFSGNQGGVQAEFTIGSLQFLLVTNAVVVKFRGEWYLTPAHTTWVIEMLKDAGT